MRARLRAPRASLGRSPIMERAAQLSLAALAFAVPALGQGCAVPPAPSDCPAAQVCDGTACVRALPPLAPAAALRSMGS